MEGTQRCDCFTTVGIECQSIGVDEIAKIVYATGMRTWKYLVIGVAIGLVLAVGWALVGHRKTVAPTLNDLANVTNQSDQVTDGNQQNTNLQPITDTSLFSTNDIQDRDPNFNFSASIPSGWVVEYRSGSRAINVYDPTAAGESLTNSKFFITYYQASDFQTPDTVQVISQSTSTINDHPAKTLVIQQKSSAPDLTDQPTWRTQQHTVIDLRASDADPAIFYSFAKAPDVSDSVFQAFVKSVQFGSTGPTSSVVYPMDNFVGRVTKKTFGQYITPTNSPIQPERFTGYHTAVDAETTAAEQGTDVPVYAIADGLIRSARTASGYGGVMLVEYTVNHETVTAVYGHIRLASVRKPAGASVRQAEQLAVLGSGGTAETDSERMHLHFGLLKGKSTDIRGYVSHESDLSAWYDPLAWLSAQHAQAPNA